MSVSNLPNSHKLPLIAIVGRPNVGKSTLFNRLIGKRRAITDPTPGVTRDPVEYRWDYEDRSALLVDTGGVKLEYKDFDRQVSDKSREVITRADCIVCMLDVTEITPEDEDIMAFLRPYKDKVFIAVNKVDNEKREQAAWEFHSFGYARVYTIAATHGTGCADLADALFAFLPEEQEMEPDTAPSHQSIRIAVLGKPNTGKSTLLNTLTNSDLAIVSDIPGTTRDVIEGRFMYRNTEYTILDTAGIRRKSKVTENVEYYSVNRAIKTIDEADVVLLMVDTLEGVTDQDKKIAGLIVKKGKGVLIVLNKWDLLEKTPNQLEAMKDRIGFVFPVLSFAPIVPVSALNASGIEELLDDVYKVYKELHKRVDTSVMNKYLEKWLSYNPPPRWKRGQYKIRYMTQVSSAPVEFAVFVNRTKGFPASYIQYLKNKIRKDLGFSRVPIEIHVRG
ncbi:MAG: ribosome biogenesis GTPase Der [Spirochaetales bacterium]|nr:ribosome biogenesis GTPase Der [Spirochaetales bacterium]